MESATGVLTVYFNCPPDEVPSDEDEVELTSNPSNPSRPRKGLAHYEFHPLRVSVVETGTSGKHTKFKARWGDLMRVSHKISQK